MVESSEFLTQFKDAVSAKGTWFNSDQLPKLLENYRLLHTCVRNLYDVLVKKSLITPDPYKLETKISDISAPEESPFIESERAVVLGSRFSNYESMLDFVCTYVKFSCEYITIQRIKKLMDLNNAFQWHNMTLNNSRTNTRALASLISEARKSSPQMQISLINDSISKSSSAITEITAILKDLMVFQRESYKFQIRHDVLGHPKFDKSKVNTQPEEIAEIKKLFPSIMGKTPYYSELIQEIAAEDLAPNRQKLQEATLEGLKVVQKVVKTKEVKVDYKGFLIESFYALSALSEVYSLIADKLSANVGILEDQKNTLFQKIKKAFRIAFNIKEPPLVYDFIIIDQKKDTKSHRNVDINLFINNLKRKSLYYAPLANKNGPELAKIKSNPDDKILEYLNKNISENQEILTLLDAGDEYFKQNVNTQDRSKIKGLKMDLITVKNAIVKAAQKRSEYCNYMEEQSQMAKLGINNDI